MLKKSIVIGKLSSLKNLDKVAVVLNEVQHRCTARCVDTADIVDMLERIERYYDIPKKYLVGFRCWIDPNAQQFPAAYKYIPESTQLLVEYATTGWKVLEIARYRCNNAEIGTQVIPEAMQKAWIARLYTSHI